MYRFIQLDEISSATSRKYYIYRLPRHRTGVLRRIFEIKKIVIYFLELWYVYMDKGCFDLISENAASHTGFLVYTGIHTPFKLHSHIPSQITITNSLEDIKITHFEDHHTTGRDHQWEKTRSGVRRSGAQPCGARARKPRQPRPPRPPRLNQPR